MRLPTAQKEELAILGCCFVGGIDSSIEAVESVPLDAFSSPDVRDTFSIIEMLVTQNQPISEYAVAKKWSETQERPIPPEILSAAADVPSSANLKSYTDVVVECWRKRRVIEAAYALWTRAQAPSAKTDELVAELERILQTEEMESVDTVDGKMAASIMIEDLERRHSLAGNLSGIGTGFYQLDSKLDGLQYGEQVVLGARPSMGKTALGLCFCAHAAFSLRIPTLFVSLEMSVASLMRRLLAMRCDIGMGEIRRGTYTEGDFHKFTKFHSLVSSSPLKFVNAVRGITINQLCAAIRRRCRRDGVKLVVVDYIQKIKPVERLEKRTYEVGEVSSALRATAVSTGCALVTLAQLNRESERDKPRAPRLCDLGDSKQIEQDADTVLLIHREKNDPDGNASLFISKQRDGEIGCLPLRFNGSFCRFENRSLL